jgi:hypothetical protein
MPNPKPNIKHMTHAELVVNCETIGQQLQEELKSSQRSIVKLENPKCGLESSILGNEPVSKAKCANATLFSSSLVISATLDRSYF